MALEEEHGFSVEVVDGFDAARAAVLLGDRGATTRRRAAHTHPGGCWVPPE